MQTLKYSYDSKISEYEKRLKSVTETLRMKESEFVNLKSSSS